MKKKVIAGLVCVSIIGIGASVLVQQMGAKDTDAVKTDYEVSEVSNQNVSELREISKDKNQKIEAHVSELYLTEAQLINSSDVIVRGTITECLGEYTLTFQDNNKEYEADRRLYEFELEETLKGNPEKDMKIAIGAVMPEDTFEIGEEFIWCLDKAENDYEGAYQVVSFSQGILSESGEKFESVKSGETYDVSGFKQMIREVEAYNAGNADISVDSAIEEELTEKNYQISLEE